MDISANIRQYAICTNEPTPSGVVISALEVIQPGFSGIDIALAAANGLESCNRGNPTILILSTFLIVVKKNVGVPPMLDYHKSISYGYLENILQYGYVTMEICE